MFSFLFLNCIFLINRYNFLYFLRLVVQDQDISRMAGQVAQAAGAPCS